MLESILEAYDNFIKSGRSAELLPEGKYIIKGLIKEGIEIEMYITKNGKIVTAYPKI